MTGIRDGYIVGNQLPILLIDFDIDISTDPESWESVTDPLDRLLGRLNRRAGLLGISYRSS